MEMFNKNQQGPEIVVNQSGYKSAMTKTFGWMFLGLAVTAGVAFYFYNNLYLVWDIATSFNGYGMFVLMIVQLGLVIALSAAVFKLPSWGARAIFLAYAAITGLTFSVLPLQFEMATIFQAFAMAAAYFGSLVVIGLTTKRDLTKIGTIAIAGLFGMIIYSVLSRVFGWGMDGFLYSMLGLVVFAGLTAYDAQKMKTIYSTYQDGEFVSKISIYMALSLYLDFINIFLFILRILGGSSRD